MADQVAEGLLHTNVQVLVEADLMLAQSAQGFAWLRLSSLRDRGSPTKIRHSKKDTIQQRDARLLCARASRVGAPTGHR
jgi:hypothetical protein